MNYQTLSESLKNKISDFKTPFFLFDLDLIASKVKHVKTALKTDHIYYAVKCNSLPVILDTLSEAGCGFEVNNLSELKKALATGVSHKKIINSSPLTPAEDISIMYSKGIRNFVFDSKNQLLNLKYNAPGSKVSLRISTTNNDSEFELSTRLGKDPKDAINLLNLAKDFDLIPYGITFHVGSQCTNPKNWDVALCECAQLFKQFSTLKIVNIGGGFPVYYNFEIPDFTNIASVINDAINLYFDSRPSIFVEPGRFLVGDAALTCSSVLQVEDTDPVSRAVIDMSVFTGFFEILESRMGITYSIETENNNKKHLYRVMGPTCAGTDIIADGVMLPKLEVDHQNPKFNSRLYHINTGAYSIDYITLGNQAGFNGARKPDVYYIQNNKII